jgi:hypothetical protein
MHGLLPNRVPLTYDFLIDTQGRFDARIEIFGENVSATLAYNTPFLRNLPTTLEWLRTEHRGSPLTVPGRVLGRMREVEGKRKVCPLGLRSSRLREPDHVPVDKYRFGGLAGVKRIVLFVFYTRRLLQEVFGPIDDELWLVSFFGDLERDPRHWSRIVTQQSQSVFHGDGLELAKELRDKIGGEVLRFRQPSLYAADASNYRELPIGVVIPRHVEDVTQTIPIANRHRCARTFAWVRYESRGPVLQRCGCVGHVETLP